MLGGALLFIIMVGTAVAAWRGNERAAAFLVLESGVWLIIDKQFEGTKLIRFGHAHSLVAADLVALAGLAVAAGCLLGPRIAQRTNRMR